MQMKYNKDSNEERITFGGSSLKRLHEGNDINSFIYALSKYIVAFSHIPDTILRSQETHP